MAQPTPYKQPLKLREVNRKYPWPYKIDIETAYCVD
jgi:hypothetical protein